MSRRASAPGPLSPATSALVAVSPIAPVATVLAPFAPTGATAHGQHGAVVFGSQGGLKVAIKAQAVHTPTSALTRAYREARILRHLNALGSFAHAYPTRQTNFVQLINVFQARENDRRTLLCVLERADSTLHSASERGLSLSLYRSALFQVLFGLKAAQEAFEFMHNDLHAKNVLLFSPALRSTQRILFRDGKTVWYTDDDLVKLTDFGLARIHVNGRTIYNKAVPYSKGFLPTKDVEQAMNEFHKLLKSVRADAWESEGEDERTVRSQLTSLRAQARKGLPVAILLRHVFFAPMLYTGEIVEVDVHVHVDEVNIGGELDALTSDFKKQLRFDDEKVVAENEGFDSSDEESSDSSLVENNVHAVPQEEEDNVPLRRSARIRRQR